MLPEEAFLREKKEVQIGENLRGRLGLDVRKHSSGFGTFGSLLFEKSLNITTLRFSHDSESTTLGIRLSWYQDRLS